jgi:hypothetical protein
MVRRTMVSGVLIGSTLLTACGSTTAPSTSNITVTSGVTLTTVGQTSQLNATEALTTGGTQDITTLSTWASSNTSVVTVSSSAFLTAVGPGTANVTATYQGQVGTLTVNIAAGVAISETYSYTGHSFTTFSSGDSCPPECRITGSFTIPLLAANLPIGPITPTSFTFTDGNTVITRANAGIPRISVSTDANGQIATWQIELQASTPAGIVLLSTINQSQSGTSDGSVILPNTNPNAYNVNDAGSWSQQP